MDCLFKFPRLDEISTSKRMSEFVDRDLAECRGRRRRRAVPRKSDC